MCHVPYVFTCSCALVQKQLRVPQRGRDLQQAFLLTKPAVESMLWYTDRASTTLPIHIMSLLTMFYYGTTCTIYTTVMLYLGFMDSKYICCTLLYVRLLSVLFVFVSIRVKLYMTMLTMFMCYYPHEPRCNHETTTVRPRLAQHSGEQATL